MSEIDLTAAVEAAARTYFEAQTGYPETIWDSASDLVKLQVREIAVGFVSAAAPIIARQVAKKIAEAVDLERGEALDMGSPHRAAALGDAARIARQVVSGG